MSALAGVQFDDEKDRVFSVGDLIDRGPNSAECLELLTEPWFHAVKGNHEDMMLGAQPDHVWMMNGGNWIHEFYMAQELELADLIRNYMFDKITVNTLQGRIGVVHADALGHWRDIGINQIDPDKVTSSVTWGRKRLGAGLSEVVEGVEAVVVGHTIVEGVQVLGNVVYIDTGAFAGGNLTMLESGEVLKRARQAMR